MFKITYRPQRITVARYWIQREPPPLPSRPWQNRWLGYSAPKLLERNRQYQYCNTIFVFIKLSKLPKLRIVLVHTYTQLSTQLNYLQLKKIKQPKTKKYPSRTTQEEPWHSHKKRHPWNITKPYQPADCLISTGCIAASISWFYEAKQRRHQFQCAKYQEVQLSPRNGEQNHSCWL